MKVRRFGTLLLLLFFVLTAVSSYAQDTVPSSEVRDRYRTALSLMGAGEYERAIETLQGIITDHPDFPPAYRSLWRASVILDEFSGPRAYLTARLERTPNNAYLHHILGRIIGDDPRADGSEEAIAQMERSIALDPLFAPAYRDLAHFHQKRGTTEEAMDFFRARLADTAAGARAYYGIGYVSTYAEHEAYKSLEAFERAIELDPELTLAHSEAVALYGETGQYAELVSASTRLLEIAERKNEIESVGYANFALGMGYLYLGDYWSALHYLNDSLELARQDGEKSREDQALNGIGNLYSILGEPEKALESYRAAYELSRAAKDRMGEASHLNNIGYALTEAGRAEESFEFYELGLEVARQEGYRLEESVLLLNIAYSHNELGAVERAVEEYLEALELVKALDHPSGVEAILRDLGKIERERGRFAEAIRYFNALLAVAEETGEAEFQMSAMLGLGRVFEQQGEDEQAMAHYSEAIEHYERARGVVLETMGGGFLEQYGNVYPSLIRLLADRGHIEEAFDIAQKYKATSLLQVVSQGRNLTNELLPESYRARFAELGNAVERTHAALSRARSQAETDTGEIERMERKVSDLELQRSSLLEQVRREEGADFQLAAPEPATLQTIRSTILRPGQTLVDYVVGEESVSAFVATQRELGYHELPVTPEELQKMLAELSPIFEKDKQMDEAARTAVLGPHLADFSIPPARALYEVLLEPLAPGLGEGSELLIVPDGLLHYLPFELLVAEHEGIRHARDFERTTFLIARHAVSYAASASLLDPTLQRPRTAERGLLAFGNPDFTREESERLPEAYYASALTYTGSLVRGNDLLPLPAAELEVAAIENALGLESRVYVGERATEAAFREEAGDYRVLHFATHFLNDDRQPLYSKIVLSHGEGSQDGYLQTYEIFNTRLNADLVVLSACNTGLGRLRNGEGLAGVSRAFLYAGVPSLVVSLWSVDDEATSIIMAAFYRQLRAGVNKDEALRQAKLHYLREAPEDKKDPFYWAPFVLVGDAQPLDLPPTRGRAFWVAVALAALALLALFLASRERAGWTSQKP